MGLKGYKMPFWSTFVVEMSIYNLLEGPLICNKYFITLCMILTV